MDFSNRDGVKKIRIALLIIGLCCLLTMITLLILKIFTALAILAIFFLLVIVVIAVLNFQYVRIMIEKNRLIVRYYSVFSVDRMYQMFDFRIEQLYSVEVYKNFMGLKWDIEFTIRIQKGLASYPRVSLSAIPFGKRSKLVMELKKLIAHKMPV